MDSPEVGLYPRPLGNLPSIVYIIRNGSVGLAADYCYTPPPEDFSDESI